MKITLEELVAHISRLILGGATEVSLQFEGGFTVLGWRYPGHPGDCLPLELEE